MPAPAHARVWPAEGSNRLGYSRVQTFLTMAVAAGVVSFALLLWWDRSSQPVVAPPVVAQNRSLDPTLAHELSAPDYWRVPSDELLALSAPPLDASLSLEPGFEVSLEESVL